MSPMLGHPAISQHINAVCILHGGHAMGNNDERPALGQMSDGFLDFFLTLRIHAGCCLIKDHVLCPGKQRPGNAHLLALSAG